MPDSHIVFWEHMFSMHGHMSLSVYSNILCVEFLSDWVFSEAKGKVSYHISWMSGVCEWHCDSLYLHCDTRFLKDFAAFLRCSWECDKKLFLTLCVCMWDRVHKTERESVCVCVCVCPCGLGITVYSYWNKWLIKIPCWRNLFVWIKMIAWKTIFLWLPWSFFYEMTTTSPFLNKQMLQKWLIIFKYALNDFHCCKLSAQYNLGNFKRWKMTHHSLVSLYKTPKYI